MQNNEDTAIPDWVLQVWDGDVTGLSEYEGNDSGEEKAEDNAEDEADDIYEFNANVEGESFDSDEVMDEALLEKAIGSDEVMDEGLEPDEPDAGLEQDEPDTKRSRTEAEPPTRHVWPVCRLPGGMPSSGSDDDSLNAVGDTSSDDLMPLTLQLAAMSSACAASSSGAASSSVAASSSPPVQPPPAPLVQPPPAPLVLMIPGRKRPSAVLGQMMG